MSFRLRVLVLVVLVALTATVATAWLILHQASQQVTQSSTADRAALDLVQNRLRDYARQHGTWEGVAALVRELGSRTGQRIHLVSESGVVIVDTDTMAGRTARSLGTSRAFVDPRPQLRLGDAPADPASATVKAVLAYRNGVRFAACLTRAGIGIVATADAVGVPEYAAGTPEARPVVSGCRSSASRTEIASVAADVGGCTQAVGPSVPTPATTPATAVTTTSPAPGQSTAGSPLLDCLSTVFTDHISDVAPVPAVAYLGTGGQPPVTLSKRPLIAAAGGVALVVIAGTLLLSHRVLRPIRGMTAAAERLGSGDLSSTVAVSGNDELAALGRTFNAMAESLRRGEERQRQLIADVAHELRTPLANLRGYLEALADGVIPPDPQLFASLHEEALLQQRIVSDLQELALAEAGHLAYHRERVDPVELLETCRTAHQATATAAGITLAVEQPPPRDLDPTGTAPRPRLDADPDRLRQVLNNLVSNALRATPAGGTVTLRADREGASAVIEVADTGTGIPPDDLAHVFDRFWRADPARGRHTGGAGLGLAITRQIVTDHGGTITADSAVGTGTTFTVRLPLADDGGRATPGAARA
jgi:two-component system sensor histidine kinase BaeS